MTCQLSSDTLTVSISALGAEVCSMKDRQGLEYLWQADKAVWPRHAPVLFPIVGRLKNNSYSSGDRSYELGQHGFARDLAFSLLEKSGTSCSFELRSDSQTLAAFPFEFIFRIDYMLNGNTLRCSYTVINSSRDPLLFSVGAHPGFNCPLLPGESFEDYYLEFDRTELFYTALDEGLRTDEKQLLHLPDGRLPMSESLFDRDALVFENGQVNRVSLRSLRSPRYITLDCSHWPYFGVWAKKGCKRFVCLEPWHGVADHAAASGRLADKAGIMQLAAGQEFAAGFSISLG